MNPSPGQFIQVRFNNGIFLDAFVEEWTDEKSILRLPEGDIVVIQRTQQDVLLFRILANQIAPMSVSNNLQTLKGKFEELHSENRDVSNLDQMTNLQREINKVEREEIRQNLISGSTQKARPINYDLPRNLPFPRPPQHSAEKAPSGNSTFGAELQHLFNQKH